MVYWERDGGSTQLWETDVLETFERIDCGGSAHIGPFRDVCPFTMDGLLVGWKPIDDGCAPFKYCPFWTDWGTEVYDGCEGRLIWGYPLLADGPPIFCCCWYATPFAVTNSWSLPGKIFSPTDVLSCCCLLFNSSSFISNCRFCSLKQTDMFSVLNTSCPFIQTHLDHSCYYPQ